MLRKEITPSAKSGYIIVKTTTIYFVCFVLSNYIRMSNDSFIRDSAYRNVRNAALGARRLTTFFFSYFPDCAILRSKKEKIRKVV